MRRRLLSAAAGIVLGVTVEPRAELGGVHVITGSARVGGDNGTTVAAPPTAIPYLAWANRGKTGMIVWLPYEK